MNCKDEELKAELYSGRAEAYFCLGKSFSNCCGLYIVRLCSVVELLDCVTLGIFFMSSIKFDYRTQWNPIERLISDWVRLGWITERSIDYVGFKLTPH